MLQRKEYNRNSAAQRRARKQGWYTAGKQSAKNTMGGAALHSTAHVEKEAALGGRTGSVRTLQPCPADMLGEAGVKATRAGGRARLEVRGAQRVLHSPLYVQSLNGIDQTYCCPNAALMPAIAGVICRATWRGRRARQGD